MIPELGHFALILATCLAAAQAVFAWGGAIGRRSAWMSVVRPIALAQCVFLLLAFGALATSFVTDDFSVAYVAQNSNSALPTLYRVAAVWGAHEGSLLLWVTLLGLWTAGIGLVVPRMPLGFGVRVLGALGVVSTGFLAFLVTTSNPFLRLFPVPEEGRDLNPLLQDPGLVMHPPILYTGYVGFSVAFAFAVAALSEGRVDAAWARWARPWTAVAWVFLTIGIALGSWWAYYELGWGGWWFWDPVENASFMPWLAGTALLHSAAVTDKRNLFRGWTVLLAIVAFALSLLGTFLVRSGVLTSVHAFASDPARGVFILGLLAFIVGGSLALYAWRASAFSAEPAARFEPMSRESLILANNVILVVALAAVLLGTVYPLILDALRWGKISVGAPYFNTVFVPLMVPLAVLVTIGALARWKRDSVSRCLRGLRAAAVGALTVGAAVALTLGGDHAWQGALGAALAAWLVLGTLAGLRARMRAGGTWGARIAGLSRSTLGMAIAHSGLAVTIAGIAVSSAITEDAVKRVLPGQEVPVAGYRFRFDAMRETTGPNYRALEADVTVRRGDAVIAVLHPQKRAYVARGMGMTEAAIDPGFTRDLYVAFGEPFEDGAISLRISVKPLVRWIWLGALVMAVGGALAAADRRYRLRPVRAAERSARPKRGRLAAEAA
ncbi:MAG: heme lyase CcmF/NrfE family subunit [Burkholderiales bacterium]